jgi:hypothetical protein
MGRDAMTNQSTDSQPRLTRQDVENVLDTSGPGSRGPRSHRDGGDCKCVQLSTQG